MGPRLLGRDRGSGEAMSEGRGRPRATYTLDDIGENVLKELRRRLSTVTDASEIPGTQLVQIAQRYLAHLEAERKILEEEEREWEHPLDLIDKDGLTLSSRHKILYEYCGMLKEHWIDCSERLNEMHYELFPGTRPEEDDDDADAVHE